MNQEQREYAILQVDKNNDEIKSLNKEIVRNTFASGFYSLAAIANVIMMVNPERYGWTDSYSINKIIQVIILLMTGGPAVIHFKSVIEKLLAKAGLQNMNNQIDYMLEMDNLSNKTGGMSK